MRDRMLALLGGLVSLLLVLMVLTPLGQPRPPEISLPTSEDRGDAGLLGLQRWLQTQDVPTVSHRRPLTELPPGTGSLLITSVPGKQALAPEEAAALWRWVERGNDLLVMAAYAAHPPWRDLAENNTETALHRLELSLGAAPPARREDLPAGTDEAALTLRVTTAHLLTAGVTRVRVPPPAAPPAALAPAFAGPWLALLAHDGRPVLWWLARGNGAAVVSAYPGLFSHRALAEADNARLMANLVNNAVHGGGRVLFDDYRFGLGEGYDPEDFYADRRLHITLAFIAAFWVLYAVGHRARLGPPQPPRPLAPARQFAEGVAGLLARRISRAELRERLWKNLVADLHRRHGPGDPWQILAASPTLPAAELAELRELRRRCERGARVDDEDYTRTLTRIREKTL